MAKKKKSQKAPTMRPKPKLETVFDCPFCNHSLCVEVKLDGQRRIGQLKCRICLTHHASKIHQLSAQVDVYCKWIDECQKLN
jgi:transcription elongation factor Elf1